MNDITTRAVIEACKENKTLAKRAATGDQHAKTMFAYKVYDSWATEVLCTVGFPLKERALSLMMGFCPQAFEDGFLIDGDLDVEISEIIERMMQKKIEADKLLQLHDDYDNLLVQINPVQIVMF